MDNPNPPPASTESRASPTQPGPDSTSSMHSNAGTNSTNNNRSINRDQANEQPVMCNGNAIQDSIEKTSPTPSPSSPTSTPRTPNWSATDPIDEAIMFSDGRARSGSGSRSPAHTEVCSEYGWPNGLDMGGPSSSRPQSPSGSGTPVSGPPRSASPTPELERSHRSVSPSPESDIPETPTVEDADDEDYNGDDERLAANGDGDHRGRRRVQAESQVYRLPASYDGASERH